MKLEDLQPNAIVRGILPDGVVTVVGVQWLGSDALELTYKDAVGGVANQLLYRGDEATLAIVEAGRPWSFDGDGALFRLVSEAQRIRLAHLFDPVLAVHTSLVEPLPHQITAVHEAMLPPQPLGYLLADDPGAGKTIMAGLLMKDLIARRPAALPGRVPRPLGHCTAMALGRLRNARAADAAVMELMGLVQRRAVGGGPRPRYRRPQNACAGQGISTAIVR